MEQIVFPKDFVWGTATASYQVEGAAHEDGRGESIWDRYSSIPGRVLNGDTGEVACDHYHRFREDIAIMKKLGMKAYRFSIAWPRIMPKGYDEINEKGIAFYSELVDALLEAGIEPYATLYHWDLPQALQDMGGWANDEMPWFFLGYAKLMFERLGDRVKHWITFNEPFCSTFIGCFEGRMAPGIQDFSTAVRSAHHIYVAHGLAVERYRAMGQDGEIGIALNLMGRRPCSDKPEDIAAAKRADGYINRWFADPLFLGKYPEDMVEWYRSKGVVLPEVTEEEMELISQKLDFVGLNYYNDSYIRYDPSVWPLELSSKNPRSIPTNDREWPITEDGFASMLKRMTYEYGIEKIIITENGASFHDVVNLEGKVEDDARCDYLNRHIRAMHRAIEDGAAVKGYFVWSLLDNFEWAFGYSSRFGIVHVNFDTQERTIKKSGYWYAGVAAKNGL